MRKSRVSRGKAQRGGDPAARAVGRRLRELREAAGLTQEAVGRQSKLTPKFISQVENGHVNPSIGVVSRLVLDGLGVPLSAFFAEGALGEVKEDLEAATAMLGGQPPESRKRALRVLKALFEG